VNAFHWILTALDRQRPRPEPPEMELVRAREAKEQRAWAVFEKINDCEHRGSMIPCGRTECGTRMCPKAWENLRLARRIA
jgi:hypothetical protein